MVELAGQGEFIRRMREMPDIQECRHVAGWRLRLLTRCAPARAAIVFLTTGATLMLDCRVPGDA